MDKIKAAGVYKNALSHGAYAQDFVLPWENEQDFVDLHKGLRDELEPDGPSEEEVVLGVAGLYWKKGDSQSGHSWLIATIPTPPLLPRQARAVGAALRNIFNPLQAKRRP